MYNKAAFSSEAVRNRTWEIFEEFDPFPWWSLLIKRMGILIRLLFVFLLLSLFVRINTDSDTLFWITVGLAVLAGLVSFLVLLIRSVMKEEKIEKFKKEHSDLATILWQ